MDEETTSKGSPIADPGTPPDEACLILIYGGPDLGRKFELRHDITIGREASNEIRMDSSHISRQHARVFRRGDEWIVVDLGSTNGTQLNGRDIVGETPLMSGDLLKVGGTIFKYIAGGNIEALFHEEIYRMTIFDGLTKIHNKRYFLDFLEREVARAKRYGSAVALLMFDIDHFKKVNDEHGHPAGDHVLEHAADVVGQLIRREQLFARYGGEEFAIVLPELEIDQVRLFAESVGKAVEEAHFEFAAVPMKVTTSVGAAALDTTMTRDQLIKAADTQLYRAKREGRNRVVVAAPLLSKSLSGRTPIPPGDPMTEQARCTRCDHALPDETASCPNCAPTTISRVMGENRTLAATTPLQAASGASPPMEVTTPSHSL
ncbi:MAG TPA: GGDEF domain-containing protein [Thermoanaerobaculia bacterium]|nr:GGDEF domain-containing protein [Thermoanaerobaculia bacterium]